MLLFHNTIIALRSLDWLKKIQKGNIGGGAAFNHLATTLWNLEPSARDWIILCWENLLHCVLKAPIKPDIALVVLITFVEPCLKYKKVF